MGYPVASKLALPLDSYKKPSWKFKQKTFYYGVDWGVHMGEDVNAPAWTKVKCIGRGKVVYSALHAGTKKKRNWGNIIIIAHKNPRTKKTFFSLYGHLQKPRVKKGDKVELGEVIGLVGKKNTPQNGWWPEHLHFGIYIGPWKGKVLPGYWKKGQKRTRISHWKAPSKFIASYARYICSIYKNRLTSFAKPCFLAAFGNRAHSRY
jgi:murein DD-endopeptidase MepM/ murein hydrolase activator NlpD